MRYNIVQGNEELNSNGGIALVGQLLTPLKGFSAIDRIRMPKVKKGYISHSAILRCKMGLLCLGHDDSAAVELFRDDILFRDSLGLPAVPSEETLRQRLEDIATANAGQALLDNCNVQLLAGVDDFGREKTEYASYVPVDLDVSVLDNSGSKKEKVGHTYKNVDGYAPLFAHLGTYGYTLANELRPGTQHSAKGSVEFAERCFKMTGCLGLASEEILLRADSAHDDGAFIAFLLKSGVKFLIKRNLRREPVEQYLALARRSGEKVGSRDGKNVYRCIISHKKPNGVDENAPMFMIIEATERLTDAGGEPLLIPDVEVNAWWTNLPENEAACITLYHSHATSEQYHAELKSDMGVEKLPSGDFAANALVLNLSALAFNCLRIIGQKALNVKDALPVKLNVSRRRIRTVMRDLIHIACKLVSHANRVWLKFGRNCPWFKTFKEIYATC